MIPLTLFPSSGPEAPQQFSAFNSGFGMVAWALTACVVVTLLVLVALALAAMRMSGMQSSRERAIDDEAQRAALEEVGVVLVEES